MIRVVHDGTGRDDPRENCAFCRGKTRYWFAKKDVAVCPACALDRAASEVPSKAEWIAKERALSEEPRRASDFLSPLSRPQLGPTLNEQAMEHPKYDNPRDPFAAPDRLPPRASESAPDASTPVQRLPE